MATIINTSDAALAAVTPRTNTVTAGSNVIVPGAKELRLTESAGIFRVSKDGSVNGTTAASASITFNASRVYLNTDALTWSTSPSVTLTGTGDTRTLTYSNMGSNDRVTVTVSLLDNGVTYTDSITIAKLLDGSDSLTVVLSNESCVVPANVLGQTQSYTGTGTTIEVYEGSQKLTYVTGTVNSSNFSISSAVTPTAKLTVGTITGANTTTATVGNHLSMADDTDLVSITYTITAKRSNGTQQTLTAVQSLSKTRAGLNYGDARSLYTDPSFQNGLNSVVVYNNAGNGVVAIAREANQTDSPFANTSAFNLAITTSTNTAAPGLGGFVQSTASRSNAIFLQRIVAKIPVGYTINWESNPIGDNSSQTWLTSQAGTGQFQEYLILRKCGATGTFGTTGHVYLTGTIVPVTWYVAYAAVYDFTGPANLLVSARLSRDSIVLPADSSGTVSSFTNAASTFSVYNGSTDDSGNWTFAITPGTGVSGTASNSNRTYTVTGLSQDSSTVTFTATRSGYATLTSTFALAKAKTGASGSNAAYVVITGDQVFKYLSGATTPTQTSITLSAALYGGLTAYSWQYYNGTSWQNFTGNTSQTFTLVHNDSAWGTSTTLRIRCVSGVYSDETTITKLYDALPTTQIVLSSPSQLLVADNSGNVSSYSGVETTASINIGNVNDSNNWQFAVTGIGGNLSYRTSASNRDILGAFTGTNLLTNSESLNTSGAGNWTVNNVSIGPDIVEAPDGTKSAEKLTASTTGTALRQVYQIGKTLTVQAYTWSFYAKAGEVSWVKLNAYTGVDRQTYFNLSNGTLGTVAAGDTASIKSVGNGWYRCIVTRTATATTNGGLSIEPTTGNGVNIPTLNVGQGIYAWGAQLETGTVPGSRTVTTVLGHNLLANSSFEFDFNGDGLADNWVTFAGGTGDAGRVLTLTMPPIGTGTGYFGSLAQRVQIFSTTNTQDTGIVYSSASIGSKIPVSNSLSYTLSAYVKSNVANKLYLLVRWYDATNTSILDNASPVLTVANAAEMTRLSVTATAPGNAASCEVMLRGITAVGEWFEVDGIQFEQNSSATAYTSNTGIRGYLRITDLLTDSGYLDITATKSGQSSQTIRYNISKNKASLNGLNTFTIALYRSSTSGTTAPTAFSGDFTYTFSTNTLSGGTLNSWSRTAPAITNGEYLWVRYAVASSTTDQDTIPASEFSTAVVQSIGGTNGTNGLNRFTIALYRSSTSGTTAPTAFTGDFTYTFSTNSLTGGTFNGWTTSAPAITNGEYLWVRYAVASSTTDQDIIPASEFSTAVVQSIGGTNGTNGLNTFTIALYRSSTSGTTAPTAFTGDFTYTFSTNSLTGGTLNSWSRTAPGIGKGEYLWVRYAVASSTTDQDTIAASEFSTAVVHSVGGIDGTTATVYYLSLSADTVKKNSENSYTPKTIVITGKQIIGNGTPSDYSGRFKVYEDSTEVFQSSADTTSVTWIPSSSKQLKFELYAAGGFTQLLDTQVVSVLTSGISAVLSNDSHVLPSDQSGNTVIYTGAETQAKVYVDGIEDSQNWQFYVSNLLNCTYQDSTETNTARSGTGKVDGNLGGQNLIFPSIPANGTWSPNAGPAGTPNYGIAPDGTQTSYATSSANSIIYKGFVAKPNTQYTYSVFVKTNLTSPIRLYVDGGLGASAAFASSSVSFTNIVSALSGQYTLSGTGAISASASVVGNNWYRISFTFAPIITPSAEATVNVHIYPQVATTQEWWGAQVNRAGIAGVYTPTTTALIDKASGSIVVDTFNILSNALNIIPNSGTASPYGLNGTWRYSTQYTLTAADSPVNTPTAVLLTHNATGLTASTIWTTRSVRSFLTPNIIAPGTTYTYSVYVKAHTNPTNAIIAIAFTSNVAPSGSSSITIGYNFNFQTQTGIFSDLNSTSGTFETHISNLGGGLEIIGSGWYRLRITFTSINGIIAANSIVSNVATGNDSTKVLTNSGAAAYTATAGSGIVFWNPQLYLGPLRPVAYSKQNYVQITGLSQDTGFVDIDAYNLNLNQTFTQRFSLSKSKQGINAVSGYLTNEAHTLPADISGTVVSGDYTAAGGTFKVFNGTTDVTTSCTFSIPTTPSNITAQINASSGVYTLSGMTADTATVTFQAQYGTTILQKVYSIAKSKSGSSGQRGNVAAELATTQTSWTATAANEANTYFTTNYSGKVLNDRITLYNTAGGFSETRYWDGSNWIQAAAEINGNLIVTGTVTGDRLAANTITADKLKIGGAGTAINDDPMFLDATAWDSLPTGIIYETNTGSAGAVGNSYIVTVPGNVNANKIVYSAKKYPIGPGKLYRLSANLWAGTGNARNMYLFVQFYDNNDVYVGNDVTGWGGTMSGYTFGGLTPENVWTRQGGQFGTGTGRPIPDNVRYVKIGVWFHYSGHPEATPFADQACQDLRLEELITGELIVEGSISASKLIAGTTISNAIFAGTLDANNITVLGSRVVESGGIRGIVNGFVTSDYFFQLSGGTSPILSRPINIFNSNGSTPTSPSGGLPAIVVGHVDIYFSTDSGTDPEYFSFDAIFNDHPYDAINDSAPTPTGRLTKLIPLRRVTSNWHASTPSLGNTVRIPISQWTHDSNNYIYLNTRFALWDNRFTKNTTSNATCEVLYSVSCTTYTFNI